jgi:ribosomal protein S18 acetylase RimI-like enzyme
MTVVIRRATEADLPALGRLGALLVRAHHEFDAKRFIAASPRTETGYASFLGTQLASADAAVFVADDDGEVIGYSYAGIEGHDWMSLRGPAGVLHDLVVDPLHRRNGAGRALLIETLAFLKSQGSPRVVLSTASQNEAAQRLFASEGFRPTMVEMTAELSE